MGMTYAPCNVSGLIKSHPIRYKIKLKTNPENINFENKFRVMDIALKKIELIEWLARLQDERLIQRIETLRKGSVKDLYEQRMPKTREELQSKLEQSEKDILEGKVHSQQEVEKYFRAKFQQ